MDRLTSMRAFVRVADLGGFAAAGRDMGLSTAMVSKHVAALERRLGVPLLSRTTRRVSPTEAGRRFHAHCAEILAAVEEAEREVGAQGREPVGCLRVTAPVEFGNLHVAPLVPRLLARHPGLSVSLDFGNRVVDLVEEGVDAAIRIAPALDTSLRGRRITTSRLVLVGAPDYLERHGTPSSPDALHAHATLSFALSLGTGWPFERGDERRVIQVEPRLLSNSAEALRTAACAGEGIALLPTFLVAEDLLAGRLRPVLAEWSHGALGVWVVHPNRRTQPARLQAFIDALLERFGDDPRREGFAR
jgi:DNA-binding transcriptional LysR family regulator